jgi:hypothetical protein
LRYQRTVENAGKDQVQEIGYDVSYVYRFSFTELVSFSLGKLALAFLCLSFLPANLEFSYKALRVYQVLDWVVYGVNYH